MSAIAFADRYRVERPLGRGGMARVDLARDVELDRLVAVKVLADDLAGDAELRERFVREGRLAARLAHPNVVGVLDAGEVDGLPVHRHGVRRRRDARRRRPPRGRAAVGPRRRARRAGARRARARARGGARAPRREAGEPAAAPRRPAQDRRLRDRARRRAVGADGGRDDPRHRGLPRPRAGARRGGRAAPRTSTGSPRCCTSCSPGGRRARSLRWASSWTRSRPRSRRCATWRRTCRSAVEEAVMIGLAARADARPTAAGLRAALTLPERPTASEQATTVIPPRVGAAPAAARRGSSWRSRPWRSPWRASSPSTPTRARPRSRGRPRPRRAARRPVRRRRRRHGTCPSGCAPTRAPGPARRARGSGRRTRPPPASPSRRR